MNKYLKQLLIFSCVAIVFAAAVVIEMRGSLHPWTPLIGTILLVVAIVALVAGTFWQRHRIQLRLDASLAASLEAARASTEASMEAAARAEAAEARVYLHQTERIEAPLPYGYERQLPRRGAFEDDFGAFDYAPKTRRKRPLALLYRSPKEIMTDLDKVVIGQEAAKRGLANGAAQHIRRVLLPAAERAEIDKSNILIAGPSGCGKTLLVETLAKAINVPFYRTEATKFTASGYVGKSVDSILQGLLRASDFDLERAQNGIVYIDEIDKKASHSDHDLDVGGTSVQQELLTILEGTKVTVQMPAGESGREETVEIDTTNIWFIASGAFCGLREIMRARLKSARGGIGFSAQLGNEAEGNNKRQETPTVADYITYGMLTEFMGRMPIQLEIDSLTVEQLERILVEPRKALVQQKRALLRPKTDLRFTRGALRAIAEEAQQIGTNGRALRSIVEAVLQPVVFNEPTLAIITAENVRNRQAEAQAKNRDSHNVNADTRHLHFIVDDDKVEETREIVAAAARELRDPMMAQPRFARHQK